MVRESFGLFRLRHLLFCLFFCGLFKTQMRQCRLVKLLTEFIDPTDQLAGTHFQESIVVMRVCL